MSSPAFTAAPPLAHLTCALPGDGAAARYAATLLADLGALAQFGAGAQPEHPAQAWARCGAMALTGAANGPAQMLPLALATCADGALAALIALAQKQCPGDLRGAYLLGERAAAAGHCRNGSISPGGSCRLLQTEDGWLALNLARPDDWQSLPALFGTDAPDWRAVETALRRMRTQAVVERGHVLGLALAAMNPPEAAAPPWYRLHYCASNKDTKSRRAAPLVIDLSSLWAGPLCGHLLQHCGATVVKVESTARPDGARRGPAVFFDLLNTGKTSVALDFADARGREQLRALLARADIVIEASRPRALRQLGVRAEDIIEQNPGLTWISISGYGRREPEEKPDRVRR